MFLNKLIENNPKLFDYAFKAHQDGLILPDTYILDLDTIISNGKKLVEEANKYDIKLYFMLKQIGRNPLIAKELMKIGFDGCVAVDFNEALLMVENNIPLSNVGHILQIPKSALDKIISSKPKFVTVYSKEKIKEINDISKRYDIVQPLLLRISDDDASLYSGQVAGFKSYEVSDVANYIESLDNVVIGGITAFPSLLYDSNINEIGATNNILGLNRAKQILIEKGYKNLNINLPSANCVSSIKLASTLGAKSLEPGHALTGTTPLHSVSNQKENIGYVYVSEISHNYEDKSYCYGGGYYRRGHMSKVAVGTSINNYEILNVKGTNDDSIDYYFEIEKNCHVSNTALLCFRSQIFTNRSNVVVVKGLSSNNPRILGYYNSLGELISKDF